MKKIIYETITDCKVYFFVNLAAPGDEFGETTIPAGICIETLTPIDGSEDAVIFQPVKYKEMEKIILPKEAREHPRKLSYTLTVDYGDFKSNFVEINTK